MNTGEIAQTIAEKVMQLIATNKPLNAEVIAGLVGDELDEVFAPDLSEDDPETAASGQELLAGVLGANAGGVDRVKSDMYKVLEYVTENESSSYEETVEAEGEDSEAATRHVYLAAVRLQQSPVLAQALTVKVELDKAESAPANGDPLPEFPASGKSKAV